MEQDKIKINEKLVWRKCECGEWLFVSLWMRIFPDGSSSALTFRTRAQKDVIPSTVRSMNISRRPAKSLQVETLNRFVLCIACSRRHQLKTFKEQK